MDFTMIKEVQHRFFCLLQLSVLGQTRQELILDQMSFLSRALWESTHSFSQEVIGRLQGKDVIWKRQNN